MKATRLSALIFAVLLICLLSTTAFAAESTTATVPVTLTVTNEYRAVNVTVPAALPVEVINGVVVTADNARIINNSKNGAIQVTSVSVTDSAFQVGDYNDFSGSKTIALKINDCITKRSGDLSITNTAFPVLRGGEDLPLIYFAKVSGDAESAKEVQAANVVFTISIVA